MSSARRSSTSSKGWWVSEPWRPLKPPAGGKAPEKPGPGPPTPGVGPVSPTGIPRPAGRGMPGPADNACAVEGPLGAGPKCAAGSAGFCDMLIVPVLPTGPRPAGRAMPGPSSRFKRYGCRCHQRLLPESRLASFLVCSGLGQLQTEGSPGK